MARRTNTSPPTSILLLRAVHRDPQVWLNVSVAAAAITPLLRQLIRAAAASRWRQLARLAAERYLLTVYVTEAMSSYLCMSAAAAAVAKL